MPPRDELSPGPDPDEPIELLPPGFPFAGVGRRVLGRIVSVLIWSMVLAVLLALADLVYDLGDQPPRVLFYAFWLLPLVVDIVLVARFGWDPGKFVVGIRVVDRRGAVPGYPRAVVRTAVVEAPRLLSVLPAAFGTIGTWVWLPWAGVLVWTMATGPDHQGWQDRAAGTYVIDRRGSAAFDELMAQRNVGPDGPGNAQDADGVA